MANTTNLDLVKPAGTDKALVSVLNANSDKIDAFAGSTNQALGNLTTPATASDLNTVTTTCVVYANDSTNHRPHDWCIVYTYAVNSTTISQMAFCVSDSIVYYRRNNGSWSDWIVLNPSRKSILSQLTVANNVTIIPGESDVVVCGNIVCVECLSFTVSETVPAWSDIAFIPAGYRPRKYAFTRTSGGDINFQINGTSGGIQVATQLLPNTIYRIIPTTWII